MVPEMLFTTTEAIGFAYGVTWNTLRRNIFNWKHEQVGNLEAKVKSFCAIPHVLKLLKDYIVFAEQEEEFASTSCASIRRWGWRKSCSGRWTRN